MRTEYNARPGGTGVNRRVFIKQTGLAVAGLSAGSAMALGAASDSRIFIILDNEDKIAAAPPSRWALSQLQSALQDAGIATNIVQRLEDAPAGARCILMAGGANSAAAQILNMLGVSAPTAPEAVGLAQAEVKGRSVLVSCGGDVRGLTYAVLELADRLRCGETPETALRVAKPIVEKPANVIRSIYRCFASEIEDKTWFYDRAMWEQYLTMLATQRVNRFSLTMGMSYNGSEGVKDAYFFFAYPFLLAVPGYEVKAAGLPDEERDRNLAMLRFISDETAARGIHFQLGLWSHGLSDPNTQGVNYPIQGLNAENQATYCRDALASLLKSCPAISGVTFRIHGESGVPDGQFDFWKTFFEAFAIGGRQVEIDMHAKEITQQMIAIALATGMPVNLSPKYWAEHMGLGYHQAAIRLHEKVREEYKEQPTGVGLGKRGFTRYGYGDLLTEDRPYGVLHRIWPGTQHLLLSGDPGLAANYGRASSFCGSRGVELLDPLTFKGRRASGIPGGRCAYLDQSLAPRYDWQKYLYSYRVWGRLIYNPDADPDVWSRYLRQKFSTAAQPAGDALASASRILMLVTTAHGVSADCGSYWPEIYLNVPMIEEVGRGRFTDTDAPRKFGNISPFDPQLFSRMDEYADALLGGTPLFKYSPLQVAQWLEELADSAASNLKRAEDTVPAKQDPEFRRLAADVRIQSGLGRFFAWKMRSGVLWHIYEVSGLAEAHTESLKAYDTAREAWAKMAEEAKSIYVSDITFGPIEPLRGSWLERLPGIDKDIADMRGDLDKNKGRKPNNVAPEILQRALQAAKAAPSRPTIVCQHDPAKDFRLGSQLDIGLSVSGGDPAQVNLYYRRINQALDWQMQPMKRDGGRFSASISGEYTRTRYPMQYYFGVDLGAAGQTVYPGLNSTLGGQPYFVIRHAA